MGWNAACILVNENGPGYFGALPPHRRERVKTLLATIYAGIQLHPVRDSNLLDELAPSKAHFAFGAYDAGCILSDRHEVIGSANDERKPVLQRCLSLCAFGRPNKLSGPPNSTGELAGPASKGTGVLSGLAGGEP